MMQIVIDALLVLMALVIIAVFVGSQTIDGLSVPDKPGKPKKPKLPRARVFSRRKEKP